MRAFGGFETIGSFTASDGAPPSTHDIDACILEFSRMWRAGKLPWTLSFPPDLERAFNAETAPGRIRDLRLTLPLGLFFYFATAITDSALFGDLGFYGLALRSLTVPWALFVILFATKLTSIARERFVGVSVIVSLTCLVLVPALSKSPTAAFGFCTASFGMIYANTTLPLRIGQAAFVTAICCPVLVLAIGMDSQISTDLALALILQVGITGPFSLIASYRMERSLRLAYLLAAKERNRLADLTGQHEALETLSQTDALTGLANRACLDARLEALFADPTNDGMPVGVLMIDVDYFKRYNDYYGHGAGDHCLRAVATALANALHGKHDLVARYGGEEFVVFLTDVSAEQAHIVARRVRQSIVDRGLPHDNRDDGIAFVTVSMGVGHDRVRNGMAIEPLLRQADQALYVAKRAGRNRVEVQVSAAA